MKGNRYIREQLDELGQILRRFPDNHMTICRALNTPKSTFYMLKKELNKENSQYFISKRKIKDFSYLFLIQKEYISKIVKPPTSPKTVKSIQK